MISGCLDKWRSFFRSAGTDDIFEVIEHAIAVAAVDCPDDLRAKRDRIAERLFSCRRTRCSGCNRVEVAVPETSDIIGDTFSRDKSSRIERDAGLDDYVDIEGDDDDIADGGRTGTDPDVSIKGSNRVTNFENPDVEALTDEIEEATQVADEVMRIKNILLSSRDESESTLYESLRRLQLMALNVDMLKSTEIGKAVNGLRKHGSKAISDLSLVLINEWKDLVDEWYNATQSVRASGDTPESINPSTVDDEEGLPSPPLDEPIFFTTQTAGMELSQFFDGMDDDGNIQNTVKNNKNCGNLRRPQTSVDKKPAVKREEKKEVSRFSGPGRPTKPANIPPKQKDLIPRKPLEKPKCSEQRKLEATKRKLYESYEQAKMAKKQRTIQMMPLHDLPKQGTAGRVPAGRPGNFNRNHR